MNCKLVAVFAVLIVVMLSETDALRFRFRGRKILRQIKKPLCNVACSYTCTAVTSGSGAPVCTPVCHNICRRVRRSGEGQDNTFTIPYPKNFAVYDSNMDDFISIDELADVLDLSPSHPGVIKTFEYADANGDSLISQSEFLEAPWVFETDDEDVEAVDSA
ncbi:EF-hand calcium-binding domain-containing protein 1-like [Liolophura sinensis]|uniref:EF-hand calcium-binding domain-containing protein 1-like n=1 Tax=Liolophura sinensis TaxID=3198878 RepID=UPI0031583928